MAGRMEIAVMMSTATASPATFCPGETISHPVARLADLAGEIEATACALHPPAGRQGPYGAFGEAHLSLRNMRYYER
jgi:hypothetical protein